MNTIARVNAVMDRVLSPIAELERHVDDLRAELHGLNERKLQVQQEIGETYVKISNLRKEKRNEER
jgi:phage shock protein A